MYHLYMDVHVYITYMLKFTLGSIDASCVNSYNLAIYARRISSIRVGCVDAVRCV